MLEDLIEERNVSHDKVARSLENAIAELITTTVSLGDTEYSTVAERIEMINQLSQFPLGQYILIHRGANAFWTDYMLEHVNHGKKTGLNIEKKPFSYLEDFILNRSVITLSSQERFMIFRQEIKKLIQPKMKIASIPCGIMRDLFELDFSNCDEVELHGYDLDQEALKLAENLGKSLKTCNFKLFQRNAWELGIDGYYDIITSNGLNIYVECQKKLISLYKNLQRALKNNGTLIIGVLTYPLEFPQSEWNKKLICSKAYKIEKALFADLLNLNWRNFKTISEVRCDFIEAGFSDVRVNFDSRKAFPTIIARK